MSTYCMPEEWKLYKAENWKAGHGFWVSNHGNIRRVKFEDDKGLPVNVYLVGGYPIAGMRDKQNKNASRYIHRMVAELFLSNKDQEQSFVLHLDYDKKNNTASNLSWATKEEKTLHHRNMPRELKAKRKLANSKLTEATVRHIKKKLNDPNRKTRMKIIAKQFGISEMQLYRIKSGENWGYVKVD